MTARFCQEDSGLRVTAEPETLPDREMFVLLLPISSCRVASSSVGESRLLAVAGVCQMLSVTIAGQSYT